MLPVALTRGIAIASTLSKVLESVILLNYSIFLPLVTFRPGLSTTLCTGVLKTTISHYTSKLKILQIIM